MADGNFKADHIRQSTGDKDIWLSPGSSMLPRREEYAEFLQHAGNIKTVRVGISAISPTKLPQRKRPARTAFVPLKIRCCSPRRVTLTALSPSPALGTAASLQEVSPTCTEGNSRRTLIGYYFRHSSTQTLTQSRASCFSMTLHVNTVSISTKGSGTYCRSASTLISA